MKTNLTLTILGGYNTIVAVAMFAFATPMSTYLVSSDNSDVLRMGELFHYGLAPAILAIGLMMLLSRNCSIDTAKNLLLGYVISMAVLMYVFFGIMANESIMNFDPLTTIPDVAMLGLAIFGYLKAK